MDAKMPLLGKRILVTRGKMQAAEFSRKLKDVGAIPIEIPLLAFKQSDKYHVIQKEIKQLHTYDWLILTSKNGVEFFFEFYEQYKIGATVTPFPKIAVVGEKTKKALLERGFQPNIVPTEFAAEGLFESLKPHLKQGSRIMLARGNLSRPFLVDELSKLGHYITDLIVYETIENNQGRDSLIELLDKREIDIITFTSPSTVSAFCKLVVDTNWRDWVKDCIFAVIGPITLQAAERMDIPIHISPKNYTIDDLLKEMIHFCNKYQEEENE